LVACFQVVLQVEEGGVGEGGEGCETGVVEGCAVVVERETVGICECGGGI
jgi:hypothetical protein